ncbi:MAG TPA: hypothetical protein VGJ86_13740 [Acidimicrobiales bacterium]|jgi:hypothetical protein
MYQFAVVALLALATVKTVDFVCDNLSFVERFRSLLTYVVGVGAVVWLDFSVFSEWNIGIRNDTLGVWMTGFVVTGFTVPWRAAFRWLTHDQANSDESLGEHMGFLRKAA